MSLRRVPELRDERMLVERRLDDPALHAFPAPVNQPHFAQTPGVRFGDVRVHDRLDVPRVERVKVERIFDWDADVHGILRPAPPWRVDYEPFPDVAAS